MFHIWYSYGIYIFLRPFKLQLDLKQLTFSICTIKTHSSTKLDNLTYFGTQNLNSHYGSFKYIEFK